MTRLIWALALSFIAFLAPDISWGAVGDVVNWYYGHSPHWYGGLCIRGDEGTKYICENESDTGYIYMMVPSATEDHILDTVRTVSLGIAKDAGLAWDPDHDYWWLSGANWYYGIGKLPENGGEFLVTWIPPYVNPYGLDYYADNDESKLYVGTSYHNEYLVYDCSGDMSGTKIPTLEKRVDVGFVPIAIARAGNDIWVADAGNNFQVFKCDQNGNKLGPSFVLPDGRESLSLAFDGQYLWVRSNKPSDHDVVKIYQIDIGYNPPSPTPSTTPDKSPTPSPAPSATPSPWLTPALIPIPDSGDYNGDGTSEIAVFRPDNALWKIQGLSDIYFGSVGAIPVPGDYDGDNTTDLATYLPEDMLWNIRGITKFYLGGEGDWPVPGDYDGDGRCDPAVYRLATGLWNIRGISSFYLGEAGDRPVPGYYTSARIKVPAVYNPAWGKWSIRGVTEFFFGEPGDIPLALRGENGVDIPSYFRPETFLWRIRGTTSTYCGAVDTWPVPLNYLGNNEQEPGVFHQGKAKWQLKNSAAFYFGKTGDIPVVGRSLPFNALLGLFTPGDFDGDGSDDLVVYRPGDGQWTIRGMTRFILGGNDGDIPLAGDCDGDGICDAGIFRRKEKRWYFPEISTFYFGDTADIPFFKDYDGDGTCDPGYWRPDEGLWHIRNITRFYFGEPGDQVFAGKFLSPTREDGIGLFRPQKGLWIIRDLTRFYAGGWGDTPLVFSYDGWGTDEVGFFRHREGKWTVKNLTSFVFGKPGDIPLAQGHFSGDEWSNPTVFRDKSGLWKIGPDLDWRYYFGQVGDIPISGR